MKRSELLTRTATGLFIVTVTLCLIFLAPWTYILWLCLIAWGGVHEFLLLKHIPVRTAPVYVFPTLIAALLLGMICVHTYHWPDSFHPNLIVSLFVPILLGALLFIFLIARLFFTTNWNALTKYTYGALGYIGIPLLCGSIFVFVDYDYRYVLIPVLLIWANDVAAYLIGSRWGKHKIAPAISPGKSLEGTMGGFLLTQFTGFVLYRIWPDIPLNYLLAMSLLTPFVALAGDLWESWLKRQAGVKDSGNLFPGHGGVLDRYDSFLFVLPLAAVAFYIFVL